MKILVALSRFPWPIEKGDKLRAYYQLRGLAETNEVHLVSLNDAPVPESDLKQLSFCKSITVIRIGKLQVAFNLLRGLFNSVPYQVNYFRSAKMRREIAAIIDAKKIDVCFVQLIRLGLNLPFDKPIGWFLDYQDAFSIGMEKRIEQSRWPVRAFVKSETHRLKAYEGRIAARFDELAIISERDAAALPPAVRDEVHIIPNGVGEDFFEQPDPAQSKDFDLVFFGNMGYHPNVQSARFLMEEVVPALQRQGANLRICIAGARPAPVIRGYAGPTVEVTGFVDDIRAWIRRSRLAIAPLVSGQGLQNKLLESMAMGIPTLTTPLANSALHATSGKEIMVCETADEFAEQIQFLLENPERATAMGLAGQQFVETHFRWEAMNAKLLAALEMATK